MATHNSMRVFSGSAHPALSRTIAKHLNTGLGKIECARFPDGEIRIHIEENVRGGGYICDSICLSPTY